MENESSTLTKCAHLSSEPETIRSELGTKTADVTVSWWPWRCYDDQDDDGDGDGDDDNDDEKNYYYDK